MHRGRQKGTNGGSCPWLGGGEIWSALPTICNERVSFQMTLSWAWQNMSAALTVTVSDVSRVNPQVSFSVPWQCCWSHVVHSNCNSVTKVLFPRPNPVSSPQCHSNLWCVGRRTSYSLRIPKWPCALVLVRSSDQWYSAKRSTLRADSLESGNWG